VTASSATNDVPRCSKWDGRKAKNALFLVVLVVEKSNLMAR